MYTFDSGAMLLIHRNNRSLTQCFTESVSLRDIGKSASRAEISSPSSLYFKAVKGAHIGSALPATNLSKTTQKLSSGKQL